MSHPDLKIGLYKDFGNKNIIRTQDLQAFDIVMLPNWCIEKMEKNTFDVFYNVESLCEMAMETIKNYLDVIENSTKGHFFTVNRNVSVLANGAHMIPVDNFPFSSTSQIIHSQNDRAIDYFHQLIRNRCYYKEILVKYSK